MNAEIAVNQFIESGKQVFGALGQLGFRDAVPPSGRRYSIPTDLINLDKSSAMRVDHVLANDAIEVVAGEVVQNSASNRASDHHPVMVDFEFGWSGSTHCYRLLDRQGIFSTLMGDAPLSKLNNGANVEPVVLNIEASLHRAGKGLQG